MIEGRKSKARGHVVDFTAGTMLKLDEKGEQLAKLTVCAFHSPRSFP